MEHIRFPTARTESLRHRLRRERTEACLARMRDGGTGVSKRRSRPGWRRRVKHPLGPLAPINDGWSGWRDHNIAAPDLRRGP